MSAGFEPAGSPEGARRGCGGGGAACGGAVSLPGSAEVALRVPQRASAARGDVARGAPVRTAARPASGAALDVSAVVGRFEAELRRYIGRRVAGPEAEDVLQDTLVRIALGVGALRSPERLAPWVFRVARSAILDHRRRRRDPLLPTAEEEPELPAEVEPDDPASESRAALAACVAPFLDSLPPEQAEALRLTDLGDLTQAEAAAKLGIPLPTLKARVQRGRKRLRETFELCCAFSQDARGGIVDYTSRWR